MPRSLASRGAGRAWDVTFHRFRDDGALARVATDVPEMGIVTTYNTALSANASARVSTRARGSVSCVPDAFWRLSFGGNAITWLRHSTTAAHLHNKLQQLNAPGANEDPENFVVDKSDRLAHGGFVWRITLPWQTTTSGEKFEVDRTKGDSLTRYDCAIRSTIVRNATFGLAGTVALRLGNATGNVAYAPANATAAEFAAALETLPEVASVRASVEILQAPPPRGNDARRWRVARGVRETPGETRGVFEASLSVASILAPSLGPVDHLCTSSRDLDTKIARIEVMLKRR